MDDFKVGDMAMILDQQDYIGYYTRYGKIVIVKTIEDNAVWVRFESTDHSPYSPLRFKKENLLNLKRIPKNIIKILI